MPRLPASVLVVEGADDREVIYQLCNAHGLDNRSLFTVEPADGVDELNYSIGGGQRNPCGNASNSSAVSSPSRPLISPIFAMPIFAGDRAAYFLSTGAMA